MAIVVATKKHSENDTRPASWRMPSAKSTSPPPRPTESGPAKFRCRFFGVARRQAMIGPTPVKNSRNRPSGALTRLKNGGPTVIFTPRTHSEITGNTVPQKIVKQMPSRIRLLNRNAASREKNDSSWFSERSSGNRHTTKAIATTSSKPRNHKKNGPSPDCVKLCTEEMTPERVRNVPKIVKLKARTMSETFHTFSMSFFSWIITDCRNAVITSQGMDAAFSTG